MEKDYLNLSEFLTLILQYFSCADKYGEKIRNGEIKNNFFVKKKGEKFTEFDYLSQKLFTLIIEKFYPKDKFIIIGEEEINSYYDKLIIDNNINSKEFLSELEKINFNEAQKSLYNIPENFNINIDITNSKISLFIDPLDGTWHLLNKNYNPVTIMLGVCINNEPYMGFIHYLFNIKDSHENFTLFSFPNEGIYKYVPSNKEFIKLNLRTNDKKFKFIGGIDKNEKILNFTKTFRNNEYICDGALGNKVIRCLLEDRIYFTPAKGYIGLWDICAASCLLKVIDKFIYLFNGQKINYPPERILLSENAVICLNQNKLKIFFEHVKKFYSESI